MGISENDDRSLSTSVQATAILTTMRIPFDCGRPLDMSDGTNCRQGSCERGTTAARTFRFSATDSAGTFLYRSTLGPPGGLLLTIASLLSLVLCGRLLTLANCAARAPPLFGPPGATN